MWKPDPGPCPVDDTPFHACTSPDYAGRSGRAVIVTPVITPATTVTVTRPVQSGGTVRSAEPTPAPAKPQTFTTAEYRRAKKGRR